MKYPHTEKRPVIDTLHGVTLQDDYRWLEEETPEVIAWDAAQNALTHSHLDGLPQRQELLRLLQTYGKYPTKSSLIRLRKSPLIFQYQKKKDEEKQVLFIAENDQAPWQEFINPNAWAKDETLDGFTVTEDGTLCGYGVAKGGDESPVLHIMEVATKKLLPDTVKGWKQRLISWLPDNSGFYYTCKPLKGEVPDGEEFYWHATYLHILGTDASSDVKVWWDDAEKERWCYLFYTHDNAYLLYNKGVFYKNSVWIRKADSEELQVITDADDASYDVTYFSGMLYIVTDKDAPNKKVFITSADQPGKEHWKEFLPEVEHKIESFRIIAGKVYVTYLENVQTNIKIFDVDGEFLRNLTLPMAGTASVFGQCDGTEVWLWFSSFTYPGTTFLYNFDEDKLDVFFRPPSAVDVKNLCTQQVWYASKDGTKIPMFLIYNAAMVQDGNNPTQLYGYGGFNISLRPAYSLTNSLWVKNGGIMAIANLRGGGEFGETWHKAGMREKKQNVFDDFIAAAEYLIHQKYTRPEKLAVVGGSNGGLLIGAIVTQRPDLMTAALCQVPLLDMIRYHHNSIANIWKEEYGSAEVAEEFAYLLKYSPYHNVVDDVKYPTILITTGINDARVDPSHARKFAAILQEKNASDNPIYLLVQDASGHGGGTTQSTQFEQWADYYGFLMHALGMEVGETTDRENTFVPSKKKRDSA